jgi:hypothetical protein
MMSAISTSNETRSGPSTDAANASEPEEKSTPVAKGADALLQTSLASMLWYWPLRQRTHSGRSRSQAGRRKGRRLR